MEIRKHHTLMTPQKYMDMDNDLKIFFSLNIVKDLTFRAESVIMLCITLLQFLVMQYHK